MQVIRRLHLIVLLAILVLIVILDLAYKNYLYDASLDPIQQLQQHSSQSGRQSLKILTDVFQGVVIYMLLVIFFFNFETYSNSYFIIIAFSLYGYFTGLLKLIYHDPRPFLTSAQIRPFSCNSTGYGNPSGHSLGTSMALLIFFFLIKRKYSWSQKWQFLAIILAAFVILSLLIGFSRVYLGVHSFNQVIYGWQWGIWLAIFLNFVVYDLLRNQLTTIIGKKDESGKFYFCRNLVVFSTMFIILIIAYVVAKYGYDEYQQIWLLRLIRECGEPEGPIFADKSFFDAASLFMHIGSVVGVMFQKFVFKRKYDQNHWNKTTKCRALARLALNLVLLIGPALMFFIIQGKTLPFSVIYIFRGMLPLFLFGFLQFGVMRRIMIACRVGSPNLENNEL